MTQILLDVPIDPASLARLRALPDVHVEVLPPAERSRELPVELLRGVHILLCKLPPRNFDDLTALELMHIATVGYEHLEHLKLADRPRRVCNARGIFDTAIGEWNVAMMIALTRDLRGMIRRQEWGLWEKAEAFQQEVRGKVVGVWGYGGLGRETARLCKALGLAVHVMTRSGVGPRSDTYALPGTGDPEGTLPDRVFRLDEESEFLAGLDFLILALPHTQASHGMIGEEQLRALPRRAFLLNPARGPIVQEQALLRALRENWIAGAALDTHFVYPLPPDHPLWRFPNVILTPHVSGADRSASFPARIGDLFVQNVERFLTGRPLLNEITAREWRET
jgi:phosphoglycerate dehydrogenase-like enzyme